MGYWFYAHFIFLSLKSGSKKPKDQLRCCAMEQCTVMSPMESVTGHLYGSFQNKFLYGNCSGDKKESSKTSPMYEILKMNEDDLIF